MQWTKLKTPWGNQRVWREPLVEVTKRTRQGPLPTEPIVDCFGHNTGRYIMQMKLAVKVALSAATMAGVMLLAAPSYAGGLNGLPDWQTGSVGAQIGCSIDKWLHIPACGSLNGGQDDHVDQNDGKPNLTDPLLPKKHWYNQVHHGGGY